MPAFVKAAASSASSVTPITATFVGGNTNGNKIFAFLIMTGAADVSTGVTDTEGNSYTKIASGAFADANNSRFATVWEADVTLGSGSNNIVSGGFSNAANALLGVAEYSGVKATAFFDKQAGIANAQTYSITPTNAGELLVTAWYFLGGGQTYSSTTEVIRTPTNGFIILADILSSASGANTVSVSTVSNPGSITVALFSAINVYSQPDARAVTATTPNSSRNVQNTLTYDVQKGDSRVPPNIPVDSRVSPNIPVDSRVAPNIPLNSRTPGTYGPGVN